MHKKVLVEVFLALHGMAVYYPGSSVKEGCLEQLFIFIMIAVHFASLWPLNGLVLSMGNNT